MNVSRLLFDPALLPKHGAVEGNGDEFGSPRGGEENRGLRRQLNNKNEISVAMWRRVAVTLTENGKKVKNDL